MKRLARLIIIVLITLITVGLSFMPLTMAVWNVTEDVGPAAAFGGSSDHTTLNLFESTHDGDTIEDGPLIANCRGAFVTSGFSFDGFGVNMTEALRIIVQADSGFETDGTDGNSGAPDYDAIASNFIGTGNVNEFYIDFIGFETSSATVQSLSLSGFDNDGQVRVAKMFFHDNVDSGVRTVNVNADFTLLIGGCLFDDVGTGADESAVRLEDASVTTDVKIVNVTVWGSLLGIKESNGISTCKNVAVALSSQTDFFSVTTQVTNRSGDGTHSGVEPNLDESDDDTNTDFTDPSIGDFTVLDNTSELHEGGTTESASWFTDLCPTALNGVAWGDTPPIGCYALDVGAPAPSFIPKIVRKY